MLVRSTQTTTALALSPFVHASGSSLEINDRASKLASAPKWMQIATANGRCGLTYLGIYDDVCWPVKDNGMKYLVTKFGPSHPVTKHVRDSEIHGRLLEHGIMKKLEDKFVGTTTTSNLYCLTLAAIAKEIDELNLDQGADLTESFTQDIAESFLTPPYTRLTKRMRELSEDKNFFQNYTASLNDYTKKRYREIYHNA